MIRAVIPILLLAGASAAQVPAGGSDPGEEPWIDLTPELVEKVTTAMDYRGRGNSVRVTLRGTPLLAQAEGEAKIEPKPGYVEIKAQLRNLKPAASFGPEFLTYVLWAVMPEGRAANLGELKVADGKSKLEVTSELGVFGLVVTAEPYFAVRQPTDLVVLENELRLDSKKPLPVVDATYKLIPRGQYERFSNPLALTIKSDVPLELYEARNAVQIARATGAERHAAEMFLKAERRLSQAEAYQARNGEKKAIVLLAREAVQIAEQARDIAEIYGRQEQLAREREAAAKKEEAARTQAEAEAQRRAAEEAERERREEAERLAREKAEKEEAERRRLEAELAAAREAARKAEEEAERARLLLREQTASYDEQRARWEQQRSQRTQNASPEVRRLSELEKGELRSRLHSQIGRVLPARETDNGLVIELPGDLFEGEGAELTVTGREKLALIAGILLSHPGLAYRARAESAGGSVTARRAEAVRAYIADQGIPEAGRAGDPEALESTDGQAGQAGQASLELMIFGDPIGLPAATGR